MTVTRAFGIFFFQLSYLQLNLLLRNKDFGVRVGLLRIFLACFIRIAFHYCKIACTINLENEK